jgi:hypothetical protein
MRRVLGIVTVGLALGGPACTEATVSGPSTIGNNASVTVETFSGTVPVGGTRFYSFTVPRAGLTTVTLLSLRENGVASSTIMLVGLGAPRAQECVPLDARQSAADVVPQVSLTPNPGVYCASIGDAGFMTGPAEFSINIVRPR